MSGRERPHQRLAIALEYDGEGAPTVSATGADALADAIVALAQDHDVPVHADETLAQLLSRLEVDEEIPERLYRVVAEVIAFAYLLKGKAPGDGTPGR